MSKATIVRIVYVLVSMYIRASFYFFGSVLIERIFYFFRRK